MDKVFAPRHVLLLLLSVCSSIAAVWAISAQQQSVSAPQCTDDPADWDWATNSLGQGPCEVAAHIEASCQDNQFVIPPIQATQHYTGPDASDSDDMCQCSTVVYSLISACVGCQGAQWTSWPDWNTNCATTLNATLSQVAIPEGMAVPFWAFQGVADDMWDNVTARGAGGLPEANSTWMPGVAESESPTSSNFTIKDALAVGIVGGFLAAVLIGVFGWLLLRCCCKAPASSRLVANSVPNMSEYEVVPSSNLDHSAASSSTTHRLYNPYDPMMYPPAEIHRAQRSSSLDTRALVYNGLPEVA
ncbi:hypothetical protein FA95DRAFT_1607135 [Auriscalpium vulgare]|uniref:Uncharacterized protein n=1 Tax=Auriscalpium vulgare TaxID=40419 RepID=A0ACB8RPY4_9AGAM|nr:hypothetical protein FA95DRAFT_1607135 [Auriscalpium vulgare]